MRILILETGEPPAPLGQRFGDYGQMIGRMLSDVDSGFAVSAAKIYDGARPGLADFDGLLISGSPAGVYEGHDWIAPTADLIKAAASAGKPQFGICFGHQLMAQVFGGEVKLSDKGWGVGVHDYEITAPAPWMTGAGARMRCAVSHQDQVVTAPPGATRIAGSEFCPNGALSYAQGPAASFQMHPEFDHEFAQSLLLARKDRIPEPVAAPARDSLRDASDRVQLGRWIATFFRQH